jgi:hypothetical protein
LTSLEQVFIKLAKEAELEAETGHKSVYSRARAAFEQFANSASLPSLNLRRNWKMFAVVDNFKDTKEGTIANLQPSKVVEGKGDPENDSSRTTVIETINTRADDSMRMTIASAVVAGETKGLNPTSSCYTEFTDASSDKTIDRSVGCPTRPPVRRVSSNVPQEVTGDSKMPAQYDDEPPSPEKSSCWSVDVSVHSCDSNNQDKARSCLHPERNAFETMDDIDCIDKDGNGQVCSTLNVIIYILRYIGVFDYLTPIVTR